MNAQPAIKESKPYIPVIDEEFDYPVPTIESVREQQRRYLTYSEADRERILDLAISVINNTDKGLHRIVKSFRQTDPTFPDTWIILKWIGASKERSHQYAQAKANQMDLIAEDTIHIADTEKDPNRARVRIDARKWVASKLAPKKYGERLDVSHSGNLNLTALSDQELMRIVQEQTGGPILIENTTSCDDK